MRRLLLVDSNNLFMRSFHAMKELRTTGGDRTGGVLGFLKGLSWCRHRTGIPLSDVVVIWDGGRCPERMAMHRTYKAGRRKDLTDEERASISQQLVWIREIMGCLEVRQILVNDVEADDLISIFANMMQDSGIGSVIFSGDGDFHALDNHFIKIYDPKKEILGLGDILAKWLVNDIKQVTLAKAIAGDPSDGIGGMFRVGPKRAGILCAYLGWKRSRKGFMRVFRNTRECSSERHQRLLDTALEKKNKDLIERNLSLIYLPDSFAKSYLTEDQQEDAMQQWLAQRKRSTRKFIGWLEKLQLESIIQNLSNW